MAIRTPRGGLNRVSRKVLLAGSIVWLVKFWIGAPILALLILLAAAVAGKIFEPLLWIGVAVAAIAFVYLLVLPFVGAWRAFQAAGALGHRSDGARAQLQA